MHLTESIQGREIYRTLALDTNSVNMVAQQRQQLRANDSEQHDSEVGVRECCVPSSPSQNSTVSMPVSAAIYISPTTQLWSAGNSFLPPARLLLLALVCAGACIAYLDPPLTSLLANIYFPTHRRTTTNNNVQQIVDLYQLKCRSRTPQPQLLLARLLGMMILPFREKPRPLPYSFGHVRNYRVISPW
jgi:hypothetical protein